MAKLLYEHESRGFQVLLKREGPVFAASAFDSDRNVGVSGLGTGALEAIQDLRDRAGDSLTGVNAIAVQNEIGMMCLELAQQQPELFTGYERPNMQSVPDSQKAWWKKNAFQMGRQVGKSEMIRQAWLSGVDSDCSCDAGPDPNPEPNFLRVAVVNPRTDEIRGLGLWYSVNTVSGSLTGKTQQDEENLDEGTTLATLNEAGEWVTPDGQAWSDLVIDTVPQGCNCDADRVCPQCHEVKTSEEANAAKADGMRTNAVLMADIQPGPVSHQRIVSFTSPDGVLHEVLVSERLVLGGTVGLAVSEIRRRGRDQVLIELPAETDDGSWRVWVRNDQLILIR